MPVLAMFDLKTHHKGCCGRRVEEPRMGKEKIKLICGLYGLPYLTTLFPKSGGGVLCKSWQCCRSVRFGNAL